MTTTLRPTGPERTDDQGGRERAYAICVNGRAVGAVRVRADADGIGEIADLAVEEQGRGRGRGTTAVLAVEEILRGWGCPRVEGVVVGEEGDPTVARLLRWAQSLGYVPAARNMVKTLPATPPELPAGLSARPLTAAEFPAWRDSRNAGYAQMLLRHAGLSPEQAEARSGASHAQLLPQGLDTPDVSIQHLLAGDDVVGMLWVRTAESPERPAWVFDVEVMEGFRGHGYGRALMLLAERVTLVAGRDRLGLNVHAGNTPAERLYESLGYRTYRWAFAKPLS
ncbi:ribosomal protein S18 acetylase RimI-like enzyme [Streptacidiphilus sp. MAP12-33]|uniref:GNAT family N-acetyltransferase n=1 Tax=Streptacidiphilus sp. MAP12-33 TaxID=3156266 RepID=UPI0035194EFB